MYASIRSSRLFVVALLVALVTAPALFAPAAALAQRRVVDPREIALTPGDLPPGFAVNPERSGSRRIEDPRGVALQVVMEREPTVQNLRSGPVYAFQRIARFDEGVAFGGFLDYVRTSAIREEGYSLVPGAPNDGGTASLVKRDGELAFYLVGFIKNDTVVFTGWGGLASVVDLPGVLALAGVSSGRYDVVLAGGSPASVRAPELASAPSGPPTVVDARGRALNGFVDGLVEQLDAFWGGVFAAEGLAYSPPIPRWVAGGEVITNACGTGRLSGPAYCGGDRSVSLYVPFFVDLWASNKDFAVATVIAHEWGHHIQVLLGVRVLGLRRELQADCMAGMFARYADDRGVLEPGDVDEALSISFESGDLEPENLRTGHGSPEQRVESFLRGYNRGGCAV